MVSVLSTGPNYAPVLSSSRPRLRIGRFQRTFLTIITTGVEKCTPRSRKFENGYCFAVWHILPQCLLLKTKAYFTTYMILQNYNWTSQVIEVWSSNGPNRIATSHLFTWVRKLIKFQKRYTYSVPNERHCTKSRNPVTVIVTYHRRNHFGWSAEL